MKVRVIKQFRNKYSKKRYKVGDILDISENRFNEINSTKHGKLVEKIEKTPKKAGE